MPLDYPILNALNGGEFSPRMYGRTDLNKYFSSARKVQNFHILPQGGLLRRSGSRYVANAIADSERSRLIPFVFSTTQAYALEFGDQKIRFFLNEGRLLASTHSFLDADVDTTAEHINITNHGYVDQNGPLRLSNSGGTLPAGLATVTDYYIALPPTLTFANAGITIASPGVFTSTAHGLDDEMGPFWLSTTGQLPTPFAPDTDYFISNSAADTFELSATKGGASINTSAAQTDGVHSLTPTPTYARDYFRLSLTAGGAAVDITGAASGGTHTITPTPGFAMEVATPYLEAELSGIGYEQSADVLYLVHENHPRMKLQRFSATNFELDEIDFQDGPYHALNLGATPTITPSATTGYITLTASSALFDPGDTNGLGRAVRLEDGSTAGWARIREYQSATVVEAQVIETLPAGAEAAWRLGIGSNAATIGYENAITFHQQRLWVGGSPGASQTFHASKTSDFETFSPNALSDVSITADSGLDYTLSSGRVNRIRWMLGIRSLIIGTVGGVWPIEPSQLGEAITPTNTNARRANISGTKFLNPIIVENRIVYITQFGRELISLGYEFEDDDFKPVNKTLLADHIIKAGVDQMAFQQQPHEVVWCVRSDGVVAALTLVDEQEIFGWGRHVLGGAFGAGESEVESVAVIPSPDESHDQIWLSVKRTVNGSTVRFIEFIEDDYEDTLTLEDAFFVDAGLSLATAGTGLSPRTITGATAANPVVITSATHGYSDGDEVRITHVAGMTELNGRTFTVANKTATTFELSGEDGSSHTAYISGGEARLIVSTISGLDHLEGETVQVLGDGAPQPDKTVSSGAITLATPASEVHVGLGYTTELETLNLEVRSNNVSGTTQGRQQRIVKVAIRFNNTLGGQIGPDADNLDTLVFRGGSDDMDAPPPLFSGDFDLNFTGGYNKHGRILIRQPQPLPMTVVSLMPSVVVARP